MQKGVCHNPATIATILPQIELYIVVYNCMKKRLNHGISIDSYIQFCCIMRMCQGSNP